jgi:hypothetical protein
VNKCFLERIRGVSLPGHLLGTHVLHAVCPLSTPCQWSP